MGLAESQFHYGSIKTIYKVFHNYHESLKSQFHYGSIKTKSRCGSVREPVKSQFHYGSIKTGNKKIHFNTERNVSIPLWFD